MRPLGAPAQDVAASFSIDAHSLAEFNVFERGIELLKGLERHVEFEEVNEDAPLPYLVGLAGDLKLKFQRQLRLGAITIRSRPKLILILSQLGRRQLHRG